MPRSSTIAKRGLSKRASSYTKKGSFSRKSSIERGRTMVEKAAIITNNREIKQLEFYLAQTNLTTGSGTPINLTNIGQGDDTNQRSGRMVLSEYVVLNVALAPSGTMDGNAYGSFIVVLDTEPDGAAPSLSEIYGTGVVTDPLLAPRNVNFLSRYKVLMRRDFSLCGETNSGVDGARNLLFREYVDLRRLAIEDRKVRYGTTAAGVPNKNSIYVIYFTSSQSTFSPGVNPIQITVGGKYCYSDL